MFESSLRALDSSSCRACHLNSPEDFWARSIPEPMSGCWLWMGGVQSKGYGLMNFRGRKWYAHRLALHLSGRDPGDLCVLHRCDNPPCVNPDHLRIGTSADNTLDMIRKGRGLWPGPRNPRRGQNGTTAKLTAAQVAEIRFLLAGKMSQRAIGARYGVTQATVSDIRCGRTWSTS
jgi:hypothetical protein